MLIAGKDAKKKKTDSISPKPPTIPMKHPESNVKNVPQKKTYKSMEPSSKSQEPPAQIQPKSNPDLLDEFQLITVALAIAIDAVQ